MVIGSNHTPSPLAPGGPRAAAPQPTAAGGDVYLGSVEQPLMLAQGPGYQGGRWVGAGPEPRPFAPAAPLRLPDNSLTGPPPRVAGPGFARPDLPPGALLGTTPYGPLPRPITGIPGGSFVPYVGPLHTMGTVGLNVLQYGNWLREGGRPIYNNPVPPIQHPRIEAR